MTESTNPKRPKTTSSSRSKPTEETRFNKNRLNAWFRKYTTDDDSQLGPDGMERFCEDIKLEPENIAMLCIAYKMNAKNMGFFTMSEWERGLADSEVLCDTPTKLQNKLNYFYNMLNDPQTFKLIFRYAYDFARVSHLTEHFRLVSAIFNCSKCFSLHFRTKINAAWT
jgi:DCN1-like protein 4/5